ncbi:hypothetical protein DKX38_029373 [Salix brachista]|uniref:Uncharacterized protein n=1 Tax=Salix brachista TaxID=2182728 RepID=A0A5N5J3U8_9ROSI|nr:hypothetical protein DKX38_029373 [Salix brachista]
MLSPPMGSSSRRWLTARSPSKPLVAATVNKSKTNKRGRSVAREELVANLAVKADGAGLGTGLPSPDVAAENVSRADFTLFSSDPMIVEVATVVGEWEIVKKKKHSNRNV